MWSFTQEKCCILEGKKLLMFSKNRNSKKKRFTEGNNSQIIFKYIRLKFLCSQSPTYSMVKTSMEMYPNAEEKPFSYSYPINVSRDVWTIWSMFWRYLNTKLISKFQFNFYVPMYCFLVPIITSNTVKKKSWVKTRFSFSQWPSEICNNFMTPNYRRVPQHCVLSFIAS